MIKVDLHMHSGEDPEDGLRYPATALVDKAVELGFGAIAITLHGKVLDDERVFDYARQKGLLLIRAVEWNLERVDVLLYNVTQAEVKPIRTFADLRAFKRDRGEDLLIIAPHPYYPVGQSLETEPGSQHRFVRCDRVLADPFAVVQPEQAGRGGGP